MNGSLGLQAEHPLLNAEVIHPETYAGTVMAYAITIYLIIGEKKMYTADIDKNGEPCILNHKGIWIASFNFIQDRDYCLELLNIKLIVLPSKPEFLIIGD